MITSDGPLTLDAAAAEDLRLLRRYEPVLRFTQGELFLPLPVERYLSQCSLWRLAGPGRNLRGRRSEERLCPPGELTTAQLATVSASWPGRDLSLRFVARPLGRREFRAWRRDKGRARLAPGSSRFAAVGLLSRFIDAAMRLSLLLRGRVPGGTAAAAERQCQAAADPHRCPYYGRVTRDRGFIALQYWFFYAMNDWRSTGNRSRSSCLTHPTNRPVRPGSPSPPTTRSATICAAGPTTPTCSGRTPTRWSTPGPGRTRAPTCRGITWSPPSPPRSRGCWPGSAG